MALISMTLTDTDTWFFFWKNVVTAREKDPAGSIIVKGAAYGKRKRSH
jgi:hypothetical protein